MEASRQSKLLARIEKRKGPVIHQYSIGSHVLVQKQSTEKLGLALKSWKEFAEAMGLPEGHEVVNG